jgi:hypothetical protein
MEAVQPAEPLLRDAPTFETVWVALQETDRILRETAKRQEKTDRQYGGNRPPDKQIHQ